MPEFHFYKDANGNENIYDYINSLKNSNNKRENQQWNRIVHYIEVVQKLGVLVAGEPYVKHLENMIWELRPGRDRILFAVCDDDSYVLLHRFLKKTNKTPKKEIDKALKKYHDYVRRMG